MIVAKLCPLVGAGCASTSSQLDAATTGDGSASPPTTSTGHHHYRSKVRHRRRGHPRHQRHHRQAVQHVHVLGVPRVDIPNPALTPGASYDERREGARVGILVERA